MADPTIAFIDTSAQAAAPGYYHVFPSEPIPGTDSLMVSKTIPLKNRSVENLLTQIAASAKPGSNIILVGHGNDRGMIFEFSRKGTDSVQLELGPMDAVRRDLNGEVKEDDTAKILMTGLPAWKKIKGLVQKVQKLGLNRVDMRSCKVGADPVVLSAFQEFFGCNTACAPVLYDEFGVIDFGKPTANPDVWDKWTKEHKDFVMTGAAPPDRCAIAVQWTPKNQLFGMADSPDAMANWVKTHLPPGSYRAGDTVFFHGVTQLGKMPIFAGDPDFRKNLREAVKGQVPSRTVDVRTAPIP
jgi:hypothetical protein